MNLTKTKKYIIKKCRIINEVIKEYEVSKNVKISRWKFVAFLNSICYFIYK